MIKSPLEILNSINKDGMKINPSYKITNNFSWSEFLSHQTDIPTLEVLNNLFKVAKTLEIYRAKLFNNSPIIIESGWRSERYNRELYEKMGKKVVKSQHCTGLAVDFNVKGFSPLQSQLLLDVVHFGGLEFAPTWTHIDLRSGIARFDINNKMINSKYDTVKHNKVFGK